MDLLKNDNIERWFRTSCSKVKSSTLVEIIVGLVILSIVLVLAMSTYLNVIGSNDMARKTKAAAILNSTVESLLKAEKYIDFYEEIEGLNVDVSFVTYEANEGLIQVISSVKKGEKTLYERNDLVQSLSSDFE